MLRCLSGESERARYESGFRSTSILVVPPPVPLPSSSRLRTTKLAPNERNSVRRCKNGRPSELSDFGATNCASSRLVALFFVLSLLLTAAADFAFCTAAAASGAARIVALKSRSRRQVGGVWHRALVVAALFNVDSLVVVVVVVALEARHTKTARFVVGSSI